MVRARGCAPRRGALIGSGCASVLLATKLSTLCRIKGRVGLTLLSKLGTTRLEGITP